MTDPPPGINSFSIPGTIYNRLYNNLFSPKVKGGTHNESFIASERSRRDTVVYRRISHDAAININTKLFVVTGTLLVRISPRYRESQPGNPPGGGVVFRVIYTRYINYVPGYIN